MMWLAGTVVAAMGLGLVVMALLGVIAKEPLHRFLRGFATSARAHYAELFVRLIAGASFVIFSPRMHFAEIFRLFGWIIIITSVALLFIPWQWHQRFAGWVIPVVIRYLQLYAFASLALGAFILYGLAYPLL